MWGIVEVKNVDVVVELVEGCGNFGIREVGFYYDDVYFVMVCWIDEFVFVLMMGLCGEWIFFGSFVV